jgi:pimeloyl-ACP methyl ester carboxylesterase
MKSIKWILAALFAAVLLIFVACGYAFYSHPMTVFTSISRRMLQSNGFSRVAVGTPVGDQVVWEGGSGPLLVFLHGAGDQAGTWSKVAPGLLPRYRVVCLDLAGHGESAPAAGPLSLGAMVSGVEAVLDQRAPGQKAVIVGNSLGAWIAMLYAQKHPDRVQRLVLIDGGAIQGDRPDLAFIPHDRVEAAKIFANILDPGSPMPPDFVLDDIVRLATHGPMSRLAQAAGDWPSYLIQDATLARFATPTDLLWGESDRMFSVDYAHRMMAPMPAARLTLVPHCGHVPQQECPKRFASQLQDVLSQPAPIPTRPLESAQAK